MQFPRVLVLLGMLALFSSASLIAQSASVPVTSGLSLWLDAQAIAPADTTQVRTSGGSIYLKNWRDSRGNGLAATQTSDTRQPLYVAVGVNSKPAVRFDGVNDYLTTNLPQITGDKSIFVVHRRTTTAQSGTEVSSSSGAGMFLGNNVSAETTGRLSVAHDLSLPGNVNNFILKSLVRSGTTETMKIDDASTVATVSDAAGGNYTISDASWRFFTGDIDEVLIYNRALTAAERQSVETYLIQKWTLQGLPVTAGLQMWLDSGKIDGTDTNQVRTASGTSYVQNWVDWRRNGLGATQASTGNQPQFVKSGFNGKPVVRFDGFDDYMTTNLAQVSGDKSIFFVHRRTTITAPGTELSSTAGSGMFMGNNGYFETKGRLFIAHDLSLVGNANTFILKSFVRAGTTETLRVNTSSTTATVSDGAAGNYNLSDSSFPFAGDVAEVLVYNRGLTDTERQSVEDYLNKKWCVYGRPMSNGLSLWLDAKTISSADPNQVRTDSSNTTYVKSWLDQRNNTLAASQTTTDNQPQYLPAGLNTTAAVHFDGTNDFLSTNVAQISGDKSIFVVHRRTSTAVIGTEISTSVGSGIFLGNNGSAETKGRIYVAHDLTLPGNANTFVLKSYVRSGSAETIGVDEATFSTSVSDAAAGNFSISDSRWPFPGDIAEVLIYNRAMGSAEKQSIEDYLVAKWSVHGLPVTSGLQLWLDAKRIDVSNPNQVQTSSGTAYLKDWPDQSGNAFDALQPTAARQPIVIANSINGSPAVRFDGVDDFLDTTLAQTTTDTSIFVVHRRSSQATGAELSSTTGSGMFLANSGSLETEGRLGVAHDLSVAGNSSVNIMLYVRKATWQSLKVNNYSTNGPALTSTGGNFRISDPGFPFAGDVAEILIYNRALTDDERLSVGNYLASKYYTDIRTVPPDLTTPTMTMAAPAPGLRVKQTVPDYSSSAAYHTLYLPKDWQSGKLYPIMVEYTGNNFYVGSDEINSTGNVEDASLGYGLTGGSGYIWICMPTVGGSPLSNQDTWWGDRATTKDYCKKTIRYVCDNYGGDPSSVVLCGFSRGGIACNYLGLDDDSMADIWVGFMPHAHYDGQYTNWPYSDADQASAKVRLQRLGGRLQFISEEIALDSPKSYLQGTGVSMAPFTFSVLPFINHTDVWTLRPVDLRTSARTWLQNVITNRPGTHAIKGTVTNASGQPVAGARIQSGYTHFTFTNASGVYTLPGLIDSSRTVSVSATGYTFSDQTVSVAGADVTPVNFVGAVAP